MPIYSRFRGAEAHFHLKMTHVSMVFQSCNKILYFAPRSAVLQAHTRSQKPIAPS